MRWVRCIVFIDIFMCIRWLIYFHLCMHVLAQFVSIINDEYRTERKCTKIFTKPANSTQSQREKKTTRYCEFCSITTIDKLQSMWKFGQPLYNRLEFVTSTKHVLWAKANEWAFTRLPISFYALSKHFSFRSHPMHACKKRPRIVYLNLIANRSIYHGNSVHASVRQMQMQTMRPYIYRNSMRSSKIHNSSPPMRVNTMCMSSVFGDVTHFCGRQYFGFSVRGGSWFRTEV